MELKTGREVELRGLTTRERIKAFDSEGQMEQMYIFSMYALGLKSLDDFDKPENSYTVEEIGEIAGEAATETGKSANPTSKG